MKRNIICWKTGKEGKELQIKKERKQNRFEKYKLKEWEGKNYKKDKRNGIKLKLWNEMVLLKEKVDYLRAVK